MGIKLKEIFAAVDFNGVTFATVEYETVVKVKGGKKNPLQGRVTKRVRAQVMLAARGGDDAAYARKVNRGLEAEGKPPVFRPQPRIWGKRADNAPLVFHNGASYLEVIVLKVLSVAVYVDGQPFDGDPTTIEGWPEKPTEGHQGGLEEKVIIRTIKEDNILSLKLFGQEYRA